MQSPHTDHAGLPSWAVADAIDIGPEPRELSRAEAVDQLTERGFDRASAQQMVTEHLDKTSHDLGTSVHAWPLEDHQVDAIARDYAWIDSDQGETLDQARDRAADYARHWDERARHYAETAPTDPAFRPASGTAAELAASAAATYAARAQAPPLFASNGADELGSSEARLPPSGPASTTEPTAAGGVVDQALSTDELVERAHTSAAAVPSQPAAAGDAEQDRRAQLADWHHADTDTASAAEDAYGEAMAREDFL